LIILDLSLLDKQIKNKNNTNNNSKEGKR